MAMLVRHFQWRTVRHYQRGARVIQLWEEPAEQHRSHNVHSNKKQELWVIIGIYHIIGVLLISDY
jgi:hypothetical protein